MEGIPWRSVQWLGLSGTFTAIGLSLIPGRGTKIPQAGQHGQKKREKKIKWKLYLSYYLFFF